MREAASARRKNRPYRGNAVNAYSGNYVIVGPPGTGKTTFLARQVQKIVDRRPAANVGGQGTSRSPVLVCSLTRAAAAEIAGREMAIPAGAVGTLHAHAYRQLGRPPVAEAHADEWNEAHPNYRIGNTAPATDEPDWDRSQRPDANAPGALAYEEYHLLRARCVPRRHWGKRDVEGFAQAWEMWKALNGYVDFTDMIDVAIRDRVPPPLTPDVILADEAQDHSALEHRLLTAWGDDAGCIMSAGDPWQAIYCWRGADPTIFGSDRIPDDRRRVLGRSYRIPAAVHRLATSWVRQLTTWEPIDYSPRQDAGGEPIEGEVSRCNEGNWTEPAALIDMAERWLEDGESVMFLASCGYLLGPLLMRLRERGMPFANPWRRSRGDWNPFARKRGVRMIDRVWAFLQNDMSFAQDAWDCWRTETMARIAHVLRADGTLRRGAKKAIRSAAECDPSREITDDDLLAWFERDALGDLQALQRERNEGMDPPPARDLAEWMVSRVAAKDEKRATYAASALCRCGPALIDQDPPIYVGTIHSFKGAEADNCILFPDLSLAGGNEWAAGDKARDAVVRLFYVGITRARKRLVLAAGKGRQAPIAPFIGE